MSTISGNVRPYESRSYGVDSATGLSWTEVRTAQNESSSSVLASLTYRNALGQTIRYETPAPNNHIRASLSAYNALGQLVSEQTEYRTQEAPLTSHLSPLTTLYAYGALGDLVRTTQTSTSGVWRATSTTSLYALDADGSVWTRDFSIASCSDPAIAALTNRTDRKITPLSQTERSHVVHYDLRGNATHETESFGRVAARSEFRTAVPWAAEPSLSIALAGHTVEVVDFASVTNRFDYDALGQRMSGTDGLGNATVYAYDAAGRLLSTTDPAGFTTSYAYDAAGRRIATTDALGNTVFTDYDAAGRVVAESGATYPVLKGYDAYGRWTSLKTTRDSATWDETRWTYDEASGVQTAKTYADGSVVRHDYDEEGRPTRTTWARGAWFENRYDEWGQIVAVSHDDPTINTSKSYDDFGQLVSSSNNAATYRYAYDDRGLVTNELAVISGITNTIVRDFDDYGRPSRLRIADSDYDQTYDYDNKGRLSVIGIPGSTVTYAYTPDSLDAGYSVLTSSNAVLTRALYRDPQRRGLILSVSNLVNGVDSGSSFDYTYDALGRPVTRNLDEFGYNVRGEVAWARYGTNTLSDIYNYDSIGNFTSNRLRGSWSQFASNELNEYTSIADDNPLLLAHNVDGNLLTNGIWSYTYDSENRLATILSNDVHVVSYKYDAFSRRVSSMEDSMTRLDFFDSWKVIQTSAVSEQGIIQNGNWWGKDLLSTLNGSGGIGGLLSVRHDGNMLVPGYDSNGNIVDYQNLSGEVKASYAYGVFGSIQTMSGSLSALLPIRFSTKPSEHSLSYYGHRFYSAEFGRWNTRDKIEESGGFNLFSFCHNRSLFMFDRLGLIEGSVATSGWSITGAGCGQVNQQTTLVWHGNDPGQLGGTIVQNVSIKRRAQDCDTGEPLDGPENDITYHEAFPTTKVISDNFGTRLIPQEQAENSRGYVRWDAVAQYYPGLDFWKLDKTIFSVDFNEPWQAAPGGYKYFPTETDPPLEAGSSGLKRWFVFRWDCCDCKKKTSYSYGAISTKRIYPEERVK